MAKVIYADVTTEHETALEVASRLAACCTFFYAHARAAYGRPLPMLEVWLVFSFTENAWRITNPGDWIADGEDVTAYKIDPHKCEGEIGREIHKLIEAGS